MNRRRRFAVAMLITAPISTTLWVWLVAIILALGTAYALNPGWM